MTISSAQCLGYMFLKGKEFCCLFMFAAPPNGELYCSMYQHESLYKYS